MRMASRVSGSSLVLVLSSPDAVTLLRKEAS